MAVALCVLGNISLAPGAQTNDVPIKGIIISIQQDVGDLTARLDPLHVKQFVDARKTMSQKTAKEIVGLIRRGELTTTQADIGIYLLSGLKEQTYWVVTQPLLTTNTENEVFDTVLNPPFPYGPGYAHTYKIEFIRKRLLQLKEQRPDYNLDLILSGENSRDYADYLKHPDAHGY